MNHGRLGKSTFVKSLISRKDLYVDLLAQRNFLNYAKNPGRLREEILAQLRCYDDSLCIVDEIQKIPALLDEVHELNIPVYVLRPGQSRRRLHDDITVINRDEFILEELEVFE